MSTSRPPRARGLRAALMVLAVPLGVAASIAFVQPGVSFEVVGTLGGAGVLTAPTDITVDRAGRVFVADAQPCRIVRLDPGGNAASVWPAEGTSSSTCAARLSAMGGPWPQTRPLVVLTARGGAAHVDLSDGSITRLHLPSGVRPVALAAPSSMDLDVADADHDRVMLYTDGGSLALPGGPFEGLVDLSTTRDRRVILAMAGRRIHVIEPGKRFARDLPEHVPTARRCVITPNDHIALLAADGSELTVLDEDGVKAQIATTSLGLDRPIAITTNDELLYVLDASSNQVVVLRENRSLLSRFTHIFR